MPGDEPVLLVALRAVHLVGPRPLGIVLRRGRRTRCMESTAILRRDLARGVAAHAVGDEEEAALRDDREVVLVVVALAADVRLAGHFDAERLCHGSPEGRWKPRARRGPRWVILAFPCGGCQQGAAAMRSKGGMPGPHRRRFRGGRSTRRRQCRVCGGGAAAGRGSRVGRGRVVGGRKLGRVGGRRGAPPWPRARRGGRRPPRGTCPG